MPGTKFNNYAVSCIVSVHCIRKEPQGTSCLFNVLLRMITLTVNSLESEGQDKGQKREVVCLLFVGILELWLVFAAPKLAFFLSRHMLCINLHTIFFLEFADESRIP